MKALRFTFMRNTFRECLCPFKEGIQFKRIIFFQKNSSIYFRRIFYRNEFSIDIRLRTNLIFRDKKYAFFLSQYEE